MTITISIKISLFVQLTTVPVTLQTTWMSVKTTGFDKWVRMLGTAVAGQLKVRKDGGRALVQAGK